MALNLLESVDRRDMRMVQSSEKLGFTPKRSIEDAVRGLCEAFVANKIPDSFDDDKYFNVKRIKTMELA